MEWVVVWPLYIQLVKVGIIYMGPENCSNFLCEDEGTDECVEYLEKHAGKCAGCEQCLCKKCYSAKQGTC